MQQDVLQALSALDKDFSLVRGYDVVPDSEYWTVVEDVTLGIVSHSGRPRITWSLRILGPTAFGRQIKRSLVITPDSLRWLKRDLFLCGLEVAALADLPYSLDNLMNLKLLVRKQIRSVHILACDGSVGEHGNLFLHMLDVQGSEYLDMQLQPRQYPQDQQEFETLIDHFVRKYECPRPRRAYLEDGKSGSVLFSTEAR